LTPSPWTLHHRCDCQDHRSHCYHDCHTPNQSRHGCHHLDSHCGPHFLHCIHYHHFLHYVGGECPHYRPSRECRPLSECLHHSHGRVGGTLVEVCVCRYTGLHISPANQ